MSETLIFASNNAGKIREIQAKLAAFSIQVIPQQDYKITEIEETGLTFVENALLKARHAAHETGYPVIADDSGLVVPALNGAPGIYSARYAGKNASSQDNIEKLLHEMKCVPSTKRYAYFYCCLVYLKHATDPTPIIAEGRWDGMILTQARGIEGFGYDPVFFDTCENKTAAELSLERKNAISHRGKALRNFLNVFTSIP